MARSLTAFLVFLFVFPPLSAFADNGMEEPGLFGMERRRDQFQKDFEYFIYPIAGRVPGLGSAAGVGATLSNMGGTDMDFTAFSVSGDFSASGLTLLNAHILPNRLIFNVGFYDFDVAQQSYNRGIDSDPDSVIYPEARGYGTTAHLNLSFNQRMLEFYVRARYGRQQLKNVRDADGNPFENIDKNWEDTNHFQMGARLDVTDDRRDPRRGFRAELVRSNDLNGSKVNSTFSVYDLNLTGYIPVGEVNTLALNMYHSFAARESVGPRSEAAIREQYSLNCNVLSDPVAKAKCAATEDQYVQQRLAYNKYGRAGSLGGTQRLRSFSNGRFYAGQSIFYGVEYRWNITEERTLMDWFIMRGFRTNFQIAFFAETGSVAEQFNDLHGRMMYSYGTGFRLLFSGATIRLDWATGNEGNEFQVFLDYPWSLFSVDNPG